MDYNDFLERMVDMGICGSQEEYAENYPVEHESAVAGYNACLGKSPHEIMELVSELTHTILHIFVEWCEDVDPFEGNREYWRARFYQNSVEFILNCTNVVLMAQRRMPLSPPRHPVLVRECIDEMIGACDLDIDIRSIEIFPKK